MSGLKKPGPKKRVEGKRKIPAGADVDPVTGLSVDDEASVASATGPARSHQPQSTSASASASASSSSAWRWWRRRRPTAAGRTAALRSIELTRPLCSSHCY